MYHKVSLCLLPVTICIRYVPLQLSSIRGTNLFLVYSWYKPPYNTNTKRRQITKETRKKTTY